MSNEGVTAADIGHELRRLRKEAGETQAETAGSIGVTRANLAQWEAGKYLPSPQNATQLDEYFHAAGALASRVEAARPSQGQPTGTSSAAGATVSREHSLATVFDRVGKRLVEWLIVDDAGDPVGWRHNLQTDSSHGALSTAYGMAALLTVGGPYVDLRLLSDRLLAMQSPQGGWRGKAGSPRLEITSAVLDGIFRVGTSLSADDALKLMERSIGPFSRTRPYLLSTALQTCVRLRPDAPVTEDLVDALLATRLETGSSGQLLWPEKNEPGLIGPLPSAVHTARAIAALREYLCYTEDDRADVNEAVDRASDWLIERLQPDLGVTEELVRPRADGSGTTRILIRHFTAAWVVQALSGRAEIPRARLNQALHTLWSRYDSITGLWAWGSGDLPIWMTLDAVRALRAVALATPAPPVSPPNPGH